jgi:replicative DNA helicase
MNIAQYPGVTNSHHEQNIDKPLPNAPIGERILLGAVLLDNSLADLLFRLVDQNDFYLYSHKQVFCAMKILWECSSPINAITVGSRLREMGWRSVEGPISSVSAIEIDVLKLRDGLPRADRAELEYYAKMVTSKSLLRSFIYRLSQIMNRAFCEAASPEIIISMSEQMIAEITERQERNSLPIIQSFGDFEVTKFAESDSVGFEIRRRELCLIASITNRGKSTMLRNAAIAIAVGCQFAPLVKTNRPRKVVLIDFETSGGRLQDDFFAMTDNLPEEKKVMLRENLFIAC